MGWAFVYVEPRDGCEPVFMNSHVMSMFVSSNPSHNSWLLNLIYCPAHYNKKWNFWDTLNNITSSFNGPAINIGDFNSMIKQSEKIGG